MVAHYQKLIAWQRAMDVAVEVHRISKSFPREELFGLTSQMRRSAVSIASNIAEGQGRGRSKDFARFLKVANGSRQELETQVILAHAFGYLSEADRDNILSLAAEVGRLIAGLLKSLRTPAITSSTRPID